MSIVIDTMCCTDISTSRNGEFLSIAMICFGNRVNVQPFQLILAQCHEKMADKGLGLQTKSSTWQVKNSPNIAIQGVPYVIANITHM
jgi:hypothetical protein